MGDKRESTPREGGGTAGGGLREFASSALLLSAVAAILLAGLALRSEPAREREPPAPEAARPVLPEPAQPSPSAAPSAPPPVGLPEPPASARVTAPSPEEPDLAALAARAADDLARIGRAPGTWTAQLVVACKPGTVDRLVRQARGASKLYVLPADVHGASCFRVCWGSYANAKDAAAARDLAAPLRGADPVRAVLITKVLP
jgi:septal ring-binding cell division protein DamX